MSDTDTVMASYENHLKAVAEANAINKKTVFDALAAAGIATVNVTFDGEGDSGQVDNIQADGSETIPQIPVELQITVWGAGKLGATKTTLRDALETLCYDYLEQEHGGWENDDGAYGEFTFDVAGRSIGLDFNARFSDSTNYTHTF
jgi:hypothetical protein